MGEGGIERAFPLTPLQEGMLFHTLREPESGIYHGQCAARLEGLLDLERFREAWRVAARRHEAFRTLFTWERRERPVQVVVENTELDFQFLDWTSLDPAEQGARWTAVKERDRRRPFDLTRAPMMRFVVARVSPERHELLWGVHHAVMDGWSGFVVLGEVLEDYHALLAGQAVDRPQPPSYAQFVGWLEAQDKTAAESFWRSALAGFGRSTPLPTGEGTGSSTERLTAELLLSREETRSLNAAASRLRVTVNTLTVGAWALLLARQANTNDVVFGVTMSQRPPEIPGVERAAGLYLSTIPTRVRVPRESDVGSWLEALQVELSEARSHSAPGLTEIQRWSDVRSGDLFDSLVVFESFPERITRSGEGWALRASTVSMTGPSNLPLAVLAYPDDELTLQIVHDPARVHVDDANRLVRQLADILAELGEDAARPLDRIASPSSAATPTEPAAFPSSTEQATAESATGSAAVEAPLEVGEADDVVRRLERRAREHPETTALVGPAVRLSYGALHRAAIGVARQIRAAGHLPGALVGILGDRSPEVVAAMLGAMRAGCAYLPLDPRLPSKRLETIADAADLVLAEDEHAHLLADQTDRPVLPLTRHQEGEADGASDLEGDREDAVETPPDAPAYVIFTSGSTGEPKGVVVERRQLAWSTAARFAYYGDHPGTFLLLSQLSVDSSVAGLYWTLCAGGTVVLPGVRAEQDLNALARLVEETEVTHTLLLPTLYRAILEHVDPRTLRSIRLVAVAGEACPRDVVGLHVDMLPGVPMYNEYGPTETTVWATVEELTSDPDGPVTIGRPVPSARVHVLDAELEPTQAGESGEICVGGPGVARGYLNRPDLTAERFVPDPDDAQSRMYRTGDLGRWRVDGRLEFLGRMDDQMKVRGYRVESAEVEGALEEHPAVAEAMVLLSRSLSGTSSSATPSSGTPPADALRPAARPVDLESLATTLVERSDAEIDELIVAALESS